MLTLTSASFFGAVIFTYRFYITFTLLRVNRKQIMKQVNKFIFLRDRDMYDWVTMGSG